MDEILNTVSASRCSVNETVFRRKYARLVFVLNYDVLAL